MIYRKSRTRRSTPMTRRETCPTCGDGRLVRTLTPKVEVTKVRGSTFTELIYQCPDCDLVVRVGPPKKKKIALNIKK